MISSAEEVRALRDRLDAAGQRLVFTNGVFDVLHAGHVRYLNQARALGDAMVVAMNSDESVRQLKGPTRPLNGEEDRAEVLCGLRAVDAVVVYASERCTALIDAIRPHIYAKGGDYTPESLNVEEKAALDRAGAAICILPLVPGRSTTALVQKMQGSSGANAGRKLRLGVLGSGTGTNFAAIRAAIAAGTLDAEIAVVLSDRDDSGVLKQARDAGLPAVFVDPGPFKTKLGDPAQKEICDRLRAAGVDLVILAGFMRRLKEPVLSAFPDRILNLHPSRLPLFPGLNAIEAALAAGHAETGSTVHVVTAGLDDGPIVAQSLVPILPGDTPVLLTERLKAAEHDLYPTAIAAHARAVGCLTPQR